MENLSNVDNPNAKPHPEPTDDPGAQIETVTPNSQKESLPNDQGISQGNTKDESVTDSDVKAPKSQENNKESEHAEIETITSDTENEDSSDDRQSAPEDSIAGHEASGEDNGMASENPEVSQDKNDEDGTGIETVTP